jgi:hypothetical protein
MPLLKTRRPKSRSRSFIYGIILGLCLALGALLSQMTQPATAQTPTPIGTVDPVPAKLELNQTRYLENCATCHIALPPAVLPNQTWQLLLQDPEHYGVTLPLISRTDKQLIWAYLSQFSRPLREDEDTPFRLTQSRHFKALHPQVKLPRPVTIETCATCHPKANVFNFRELATEN